MPRDAVLVGMEEESPFFAVPDQSALRGQDDLVAASGDGPADQLLGVSIAVGGGGVDEVDAVVQRGVDGGERLFVVARRPTSSRRWPRPQNPRPKP